MQNEIQIESGFIEIPNYSQPACATSESRKFFEIMNRRRSVRNFSNRSVEAEVLLNAIRTAGTAPSGANCQPWFFALIESQSVKDKIREDAEKVERAFYSEKAPADWLSDLKPLGTSAHKPYLSIAPALIAVFSRRKSDTSDNSPKSYYPLESTGIAVGFLLAALHQAGLAALTHTPRPLHFLNQTLGLDRSYVPFMLVVTGYPYEPIKVPDLQRKPLGEIYQSF